MPRITRVTTRTGDDGSTALGNGQRLPKDNPRIAAFGTVDELNSLIGVVRAAGVSGAVDAALATAQNDLFHLGAELCVPRKAGEESNGPCIEDRHIDGLEEVMEELLKPLPELENFVLPGGCSAAAQLHVARTVCRRAEREAVTLSGLESIRPEVVRYLNRLSDALFVMARYENLKQGQPDVMWNSRA